MDDLDGALAALAERRRLAARAPEPLPCLLLAFLDIQKREMLMLREASDRES
jgi:hypothetical protein